MQNANLSFMKKIFVQKEITHSIRKHLPVHIPKTRTSSYGIESYSFLGCKLWNSIPVEFRSIKTLASFKDKVKDGKITATAGYAENSLVTPASLLNSIDLHSFYVLHLYTSVIFLLLCKYILIIVSYYLKYDFLQVVGLIS